MAITSRPQDKYAFLFTGPTLPRFMKDLQNVYTVLTTFYNYPAANIRVVLGSTPASMPSFPVTTIASVAALQTEMDTFAAAASGPIAGMPGAAKSALLYFTGGGDNSTGPARLLLDGGAATAANTIDSAWLAARLAAFTNCHVNVVMQQSFAGGFAGIFGAVTFPGWSFTTACGTAQEAPGNSTDGGFFTYGWCKALRYETLPAGTPDAGQYADTLGSAAEANDALISTGEAMTFGKQIHDALGFGALATPMAITGGGAQFLGLPSFRIRDGAVAWWESEDIYLTYPNHPGVVASDNYIPDAVGATPPYNNTITVKVRNLGTHPVRRYSLGIELFKTGTGPTTEQHPISDKVPAGGVLLPIAAAAIGTAADRVDKAEWNTAFTIGTTHECIKAEAKLLSTDIDYSWDIVARDFEAQRNTDQMALAPIVTQQPPPMPDIQGFKQHRYGIYNRFDLPRRHVVLFPREYAKATNGYVLNWLEDRGGQLIPIDVIMQPRPHIMISVEPHATRTLVLRAQAKRSATARPDEIRLPFTIAVEGEWPANHRAADFPAAATAGPDYAEIGGFTVVLRQESATIRGTIFDRAGKPAAGATVMLATVDGLQRVAVKTDAQGRYELVNINPDVYVIRTETDQLRSKEQTVLLGDGKTEVTDVRLAQDTTPPVKHVKVILDRIRITKDLEPRIKGKADLSFTTEVVPDLDDAQKQVTRLPKKGVTHASDKPGANDIQFGTTLFDGFVKKNTLTIKIGGKEHDLLDPDDRLKTYERAFSGDPESWLGSYQPADERFDPEDVGDWSVWYRIVSV